MIKSKPCLSAKCKNRHKSDGDYCAEHAHLERKQTMAWPRIRACSDPHLAEEYDAHVGYAWSLKRNVL